MHPQWIHVVANQCRRSHVLSQSLTWATHDLCRHRCVYVVLAHVSEDDIVLSRPSVGRGHPHHEAHRSCGTYGAPLPELARLTGCSITLVCRWDARRDCWCCGTDCASLCVPVHARRHCGDTTVALSPSFGSSPHGGRGIRAANVRQSPSVKCRGGHAGPCKTKNQLATLNAGVPARRLLWLRNLVSTCTVRRARVGDEEAGRSDTAPARTDAG